MANPTLGLPDTLLRLAKRASRIGRQLPIGRTVIQGSRNRARTQLLNLMPKQSVCAEIGVWKGKFSEQILDVVEPTRLFLIDPWSFCGEEQDQWHGGNQGHTTSQIALDAVYEEVKARFLPLGNVSVVRQPSGRAVNEFDDEYFDWVYIDGNHSYEYVRADLEAFLSKVKRNGYLTGDDYFWAPEEGFPIKRAVEETVRSGRARLLSVRRGQWIVQKT